MDQLYGEIEIARVFDYHNLHLNTHIVNVNMINLTYILLLLVHKQNVNDLQQIFRMITTNNMYSISHLNTSKIYLLKKNLCPFQTTMFR